MNSLILFLLAATPQIPVYHNGPYRPPQYPQVFACAADEALGWDGTDFSCVAVGSSVVVPAGACSSGEALFWDGSAYSCISNIDSATSLLANPTDCTSGQFADTIDQYGNLTCSAWTHLFWGSKHTDVFTGDTVAHGAFTYYSNYCADPPCEGENRWRLIYAPASDDYVLGASSTSTDPEWRAVPDCDLSDRALQYDQSTNTFSCNSSITAATATALASNPTDCASTEYAHSIDAAGNLTCSQLDASEITGLDNESWHVIGDTGEPAFTNSWVNFGTGGNGVNQTAAFYKDHTGRVCLRGLVKSGTVSSTSSGNIFTLPAGYRPTLIEMFLVMSNGITGPGRLDIHPAGDVRMVQGSNATVSLANVCFRVD